MNISNGSRVGVVIVTYNNAGMLKSMLAELSAQTRKPDEVIVIDNDSKDDTTSVVEQSPIPVRYVHFNTNLGSAGGFREGIRLACEKGDLIWLLDDDVMIEHSALKSLVDGMCVLAGKEKIGAVRSWGQAAAPFTEPRQARGFAWRGTLIRKDVVEAIGLPRDDYFLYGEDSEFSMRMVKKGYSIYWIPESRVIERHSDAKTHIRFLGRDIAIHKDPWRLYYATRNQLSIFLEYKNIKGLMASWIYIVKEILFFALFVRQGSVERIKAIVSGIRDAMRGRLGINARYIPSRTR